VSVVLQQPASDNQSPIGVRLTVSYPEGEVFLGVSHSKMKTLIREGKIQSIKIGGSRRILVKSLIEVSEHGTK
jgi:hypothetical protein